MQKAASGLIDSTVTVGLCQSRFALHTKFRLAEHNVRIEHHILWKVA